MIHYLDHLYDEEVKNRYIRGNEFKNIQTKQRVVYQWKKFIIEMRKEVNPSIQTELFVDVNMKRRNNRILYKKKLIQLSKTFEDKKYKCNRCDNIVVNEHKVVINKLYLFRKTYCKDCYLELKKDFL